MTLKSAWRSLFAPDTTKTLPVKDARNNHTFSDEDRESAQEIRSVRYEIRRMQEKARLLEAKRDLQELQEEIASSTEEIAENDDALLTILAPLITKFIANQPSLSTHAPTTPPSVTVNEDTVREYLNTQSKANIALAKTMPKQDLFQRVKSQLPNMTLEEFEMMYRILVTEY